MNLYQIQFANLPQQMFKNNRIKQNIFLAESANSNRIGRKFKSDKGLKRGEKE